MNKDKETAPVEKSEIDWGEVARAALGSAVLAGLVGGALKVLGAIVENEARASAERQAAAESRNSADEEGCLDGDDYEDDALPDEDDPVDDDAIDSEEDEAAEAAAILGVDDDASEDEIRAALRARLANSRIHPDQGGDEEGAKRLIAAKNLLIERRRAA